MGHFGMSEVREHNGVIEYIDTCCGIYFRSIVLQKGEIADQHVHEFDHATYIGNGRVRLRAGGALVGDYAAGQVVAVVANTHHTFEALEANTRLTCVHDAKSAEAIRLKQL